MQCLSSLLHLYFLFNVFRTSISKDKDVFKIAALFTADEIDAETAFKLAVHRRNLYSYDTHFEAQIEHVSRTNTFSTSKLVCDILEAEEGVVAVFGPGAVITSPITESICHKFEIPHIQTNWNAYPNRMRNTVVNFYPDSDDFIEGLAVVLQSMNWKNYAVLYEDDDALIRLQRVFEFARMDSNPVVYRKLNKDYDNRIILKELVNTTINQMILDCETDHILTILEQAKELTLLDSFHSFFLTALDAHTLNLSTLNTFANITVMRFVDINSPAVKLLAQDWEIYDAGKDLQITPNNVKLDAALMYDAANHLMDSVIELQKTEEVVSRKMKCEESEVWEHGLRISAYLNTRLNQNTVTGPLKFDGNGSRIDFTLDLLELVNGQLVKTAEYHSKQPGSVNILRTRDEQEQQALESLQKQLVIVASRIGPPYLMRRKISHPGEALTGNDEFEGYSLDLIDAIAKELNFTYLFKITENNAYGSYNPDTKKWNGLIRDLLDHKAHLAICDLTITYQRRQVVDFSSPFMDLGIAILFKDEPEEETNIFKFMLPLSFEVWLYTISAYLAVSVTLFFVARMAPGDWENPHPCEDNPEELENIWTFKNCMWFTMGSLMNQGCDLLPKGISSRMAATMWWFFCLLMTSSYTANLAAFLSTQNMGPSIDSAEALSKQTKIKYGLVEGGATEAFFRESNFSTYKRMWTQMQGFKPSVFEKNNPDGVKRVLNSKETSPYAFLMESSSIEYETASKCSLKAIGDPLDSKRYGIAMPMDAKYRSAINKVILNMQELGNLTRLKTKWWKEMIEGGACPEKVQEENSIELGLANVGGVFVVLCIGISIAFLIAIFEFMWNAVDVAVQEHMSYKDALVSEFKFVINVLETRKAINRQVSDSSSNSERHSIVKEGIKLEEMSVKSERIES